MASTAITYIRIHWKMQIKRSMILEDIAFVKACIKFNLTPNFAKIKQHTLISSTKHQRLTKSILSEEIRKHYKKLHYINLQLLETYNDLAKLLHQIEMECIQEKIREDVSRGLIEKRRKQNMKLKSLRNQVRNNEERRSKHTKDKHQPNKFTNLTDVVFTEAEKRILNRGHKFAPASSNHKNLEVLAVEMDAAIMGHPQELTIRRELTSLISKEKQKLKYHKVDNYDLKIVNSIKQKIKQNNLSVTLADKGGGLVFIKKSEYIEKTLQFLRENNFITINKNPLNQYIKYIKANIAEHAQFLQNNNIQINNLIPLNPKMPTLYGMPKLHKLNIPIRPIISSIGSPAYKLNKHLTHLLTNKYKFDSKHSVKNTNEFIKELKTIKLEPTNKKIRMISFDIIDLYTNVPTSQTIKIIERSLKDRNVDCLEIESFINLLTACTNQNFFSFDNNYYKIINGLPMGSPLSPILSNIFMDRIDKQILANQTFKNQIIFYKRYVDDIFCLFEGNDVELNLLKDFINSLHVKIKFTTEIEQNNKLNFLNLSITNTNNYFTFEIFRKPTNKNIIIPNSSNHSYSQKLSSLHYHLQNLLNLPIENKEVELKFIKDLALNNDFTEKTIDRIIHKKQLQLNPLYNKQTNKNTSFRIFTFHKNLPNNLHKLLSKYNLKPAFRTNNTLASQLINVKPKIDTLDKSGVYSISCNKCNSIYYGHTRRTLRIRYNEHLRQQNSNVYKHLKETKHMITPNNVKLLYPEEKFNKLILLENLVIEKGLKDKNIKCLNDQIMLNFIPIFRALQIDNPTNNNIYVDGRRDTSRHLSTVTSKTTSDHAF